MDDLIARIIQTAQKFAYAIADHNGIVQSVHGDPLILWGRDQGAYGSIGHSLWALVPELTGSEEAVRAVQRGERGHLRFESLNRTDADGAVRYVTLSVHSFYDVDAAADRLLFLAQDVTEQGIVQQELMQRHNELCLLQERLERQNQELAASNTELRLMNEIRSSFISVAAHELRTPLTSIYGFLELLQDTGVDNLTEEQQEHLVWMEKSTQRLLNTLNELLDAARIDSDRLELVLRPVPLCRLIAQAANAFDLRLSARNQQLKVDMPAGLPDALCDPDRIEQVLGHLLSNASKFTPEGGTISLTVRPTPSGEFLRLSVSDQGQGIAREEEIRLFERFYRSQHVRKNGVAGAGLGLYITRSLVELHGGDIWYESKPGQGAVFHVTVPVADPPTNDHADRRGHSICPRHAMHVSHNHRDSAR